MKKQIKRYTVKFFDRKTKQSVLPVLKSMVDDYYYGEVDFKAIPYLFVAYHDKEIVAFSGLACYHGKWCLRLTIVKPEHRGNGLQRKLIKARVKYLKGRLVDHVNVWVYQNNIHSLNNVLGAGFKPVKTKPREFNGVNHFKYKLEIMSKHEIAFERAVRNFESSETWKKVMSNVKYVHELGDNRVFID